VSTAEYPIPAPLNLALSAATLVTLVTILSSAGRVHSAWSLLGLAVCYGLMMNMGYALAHESSTVSCIRTGRSTCGAA
jgi:hypothetical protein